MIGSHNTMSYQPVRQWYFKPLSWMGRCQHVNLQDQFIRYGCRLFDFRVRYDKYGNATFAHGPIQFHGHVTTYISELNNLAANSSTPVYARIILESNSKMKDQRDQERYFKSLCENIQNKYKNIIFIGGRRKYDWEIIYDFGTKEPTLFDKYSSTTNPFGERTNTFWDKIDDLWPWLYARINNKKNIKKYSKSDHKESDVLFIDFVNIR